MARKVAGATAETAEEKLTEFLPTEDVAPEAAPAEAPVAAAAPPPVEEKPVRVIPPPPVAYRVLRDHGVLIDSCRVVLRAGKVLDEANYNIELLKSQGVPLEKV